VHWLDAAAPDLVATVLGLADPSEGAPRSG
jgi:hypothetical protein